LTKHLARASQQKKRDSGQDRAVRTLGLGEEKKHLQMLNLAYNSWGDEEEWRKKYVQPEFDVTQNVLVVEEEGEWAGGGTAWFREAILENGEKVKVYAAGDLYVHPNHRGKGIYSTAMENLNKMAYERGAVLGFAFPSIFRLPSVALQNYGFVNIIHPKTRICILNPENFLTYIISQLKTAYLPLRFDGMTVKLTVHFDFPRKGASMNRTFRVEKGAISEFTETKKIDLKIAMRIDTLLKLSSAFYLGKKTLFLMLFSSIIRGRLRFSFSSRFLKAFLGL
jgi:GNAT superfamily N-acetyltransferase